MILKKNMTIKQSLKKLKIYIIINILLNSMKIKYINYLKNGIEIV